jgi:hypothetical protein
MTNEPTKREILKKMGLAPMTPHPILEARKGKEKKNV